MVEPLSGSWIVDKVNSFLDTVAMEPLPHVWIGEPEYENGTLMNPAVDGLRLMQHLPRGFTGAEQFDGQAAF